MQSYYSMSVRFNSLLTLLFLFAFQPVFGQGSNSPYTILGLGKPLPVQNIRTMGMGGVSTSNGSGLYSNFANPALLPHNKLTIFEAAYLGEYKQLSDPNTVQNAIGANLGYLTMGFPVSNRWTMGVGLRPLSTVNYRVSSIELIPNTPTFVEYEFAGEGGLAQVFFSNGFNIWRGFSLGLELQYNFGSINSDSKSTLDDGQNEYVVGIFERANYSKLHWKGGFAYLFNFSEKLLMNIGATYQPKAEFNASSLLSTQRRTLDNIKLQVDTLNYVTDQQITYPSVYSLGVSIENTGRFTAGVDYTMENWSEFTTTDGTTPLEDAYRINVGVEWTPDYTSVNNYLKRITFRLGAHYEQTPWVVEGIQLEDRSITFGFSLPVVRSFSSISTAIQYGRLSSSADNLISEEYFRFNLGLTINDRWFIKRRVN